jgi:hypothetical protein
MLNMGLLYRLTPCQGQALAEVLCVPLVTSDARIERSGAARCEVEVFSTQA